MENADLASTDFCFRLKNFDKNIKTDLDKNIWTENSVEYPQ